MSGEEKRLRILENNFATASPVAGVKQNNVVPKKLTFHYLYLIPIPTASYFQIRK